MEIYKVTAVEHSEGAEVGGLEMFRMYPGICGEKAAENGAFGSCFRHPNPRVWPL
jgi:hypothetical protein